MTITEQLQPLAISIDMLHPDPSNARRHGEKNIEAIKSSLSMFGQRKPVVVQRNGMIKCFGLELDPKYCDVIVHRWENLTGRKATRG